jgi:glycosyltransferase involved in cell wall biosynthesis
MLDHCNVNCMAETPLVSVIILCYNQEAYINETVSSILESDFTYLEIIVPDDGSTDSSVEIVEEWIRNDNRIQFFRQLNGGPSAARNQAIPKASGKFLFPVDRDDLISKDYISQAVSVLREKSAVGTNLRN